MASETEICQLALRRLGQAASITSLNEQSVYAEMAKSAYPIVRDALLERHAWDFATTTVDLQKLEEKPSGTWEAMYQVPSDCIRVLTVSGPGPISVWATEPWTVEMHGKTRVLLTNIVRPSMKYVRKTTNTELFSATFTDALAWHISASLAGPIVKGETGMNVGQKLLQYAQFYEQAAIKSDVTQRHLPTYHPEAPWYLE